MVSSSSFSSFNSTGLVLSVIDSIGRTFCLVYIKTECDGLIPPSQCVSLGCVVFWDQTKFNYRSDMTIVNKNAYVSFE